MAASTQKNKFLQPSRRILLVIVFGALIIAFAIFNSRGKKISVVRAEDNVLSKNGTAALINGDISKTNALDSDNDGLKDWEETLWGTDQHKADTDNDGTSDGIEVNEGRDPLIPGPNDVFADKEAVQKLRASTQETENLNATDRFARDLFAKYLLFKQTGASLDEESRDAVLNSALESIVASSSPKTWNTAQIKTIPANDTVRRQYGTTLGAILQQHTPSDAKNELYLLAQMSESEDYSNAALLLKMANSYASILQKYAALTVPDDAVTLHVHLLNVISAIETDVRAFSGIEKDPVTSLAHVKPYGENVDRLKAALSALQTYFSEHNIRYEHSDPGYSFTQSAR